MKIYEVSPVLENKDFQLRLTVEADCEDLLEVYSDKLALPFFNSDNCHGDNFFYPTKERMLEAFRFWQASYENRWFARLSIVDRKISKVIGTIEICRRVSDDAFDGMGILRVDVRHEYEREAVLQSIFALTLTHMFTLSGCSALITKAPIYAVDRINAIQRLGFEKSPHHLIGGHDGYAYNGYWIIKQTETKG